MLAICWSFEPLHDNACNVVGITCASLDIIAHRGILEASVQFMSKPVGSDELARKVREVLDRCMPG